MAVLTFVTAACSDSAAAPECVQIADDTIAMLQDMIEAVEALPVEDLPDSTAPNVLLGALDTNTFFELRGRADSLGAQGTELGCDEAEGQELVLERTGRLQATTEIGRTMRDGIIAGIEATVIN